MRKFNDLLASKKVLVMGAINVTPDSFSDGGRFYVNGELNIDSVLRAIFQMVQDGADIIDIGGESTGPGSKDVAEEEELLRVVPVIQALRKVERGVDSERPDFVADLSIGHRQSGFDFARRIWVSVDTWKGEVARQAVAAGADFVNDVTGLRGDLNMVRFIAEFGVPAVLMYSKDSTARTSLKNIIYRDVVASVKRFLEERIEYAEAHGVKREQLILDPGMGAFVSSEAKYSLELLDRLREFEFFGLPLLVGPSRKSFIGEVLDLPVDERLEGTLAASVIAVMNGAKIVRGHDVRALRRAVDMAVAVFNSSSLPASEAN